MPHIFNTFRKSNFKIKKKKFKTILKLDKLKPIKPPTPQEIFGKDINVSNAKKK